MTLTRRDYGVIAGLFGLAVASGFIIELLESAAVITVHDVTFYLPSAALLLGAAFVYQAYGNFGGSIGRDLEVLGISLVLLGFTWIVFAGFFAAGFPAWGITPGFWTAFLGLMVMTSFLLVAYGFYLFWKTGTGQRGPL